VGAADGAHRDVPLPGGQGTPGPGAATGASAKGVVAMNRILPPRAYDSVVRRQYGLPR
jgi:hypothetical protein